MWFTKSSQQARLSLATLAMAPGDIIFTATHSPISYALRMLQGSFPYSHVCLAGPRVDSMQTIYTTGIWKQFAFRYEQVPASDYLRGKQFEVCRFISLTPEQQAGLMAWCQAHTDSRYPFLKVLVLMAKGFMGNGVDRVRFLQESRPFCAEGVAAAYLSVGITLGPRANNADPSGYDVREIYEDDRLQTVFQAGN
jgi:hypothetical protein